MMGDQQPDTTLAILKFEFVTAPRRVSMASTFTIDDHPTSWTGICNMDGPSESLGEIAKQENGAARLLVALMWSNILELTEDNYPQFWRFVREDASKILYSFSNAPENYLCWVQGIKRPDRTLLKHIKFVENGAFFIVDREGKVDWIPFEEGLNLSRPEFLLSELPEYNIRLV